MRRRLRVMEREAQQPERRGQRSDCRERAWIQAQRTVDAVRLMRTVVSGSLGRSAVVVDIRGKSGMCSAVLGVAAVVLDVGCPGRPTGQPEHLPERRRLICKDESGERRRGGAEKRRQQREPCDRSKSNHSCCSILIRDQREANYLHARVHLRLTMSMQQNGGECAGPPHPVSRAHVLTARSHSGRWNRCARGVRCKRYRRHHAADSASRTPPLRRRRSTRSVRRNDRPRPARRPSILACCR